MRKTYLTAWGARESLDQPENPCSLIIQFALHMKASMNPRLARGNIDDSYWIKKILRLSTFSLNAGPEIHEASHLFQCQESLPTTFPDLIHTPKCPWSQVFKYGIVLDIVGGCSVLIQLHYILLNTCDNIRLWIENKYSYNSRECKVYNNFNGNSQRKIDLSELVVFNTL